MKVCKKCGAERPLSAFYKHRKMSDGHLNICKECKKEYARLKVEEKSKDPNWVEKEQARHREKYYRLGYKDKHKPSTEDKREVMTNYRSRYPEKYKAKIASQRVPTPFEGAERHHWSYKEEHRKDVLFLSKEHHYRLHREIEYDQSTMQYTFNGIPLENKEDHVLVLMGAILKDFKN